MKYFKETLYDAVCQEYRVDKLYFESKTEHQHLMIFHNAQLGRVMTLDGVVQTTEADEFIYHEMLAHVPILAHGEVERVLIIGGGDGGMLREVCKHQNVKHITQVEIDQAVVDMAIEYLPNHSAGAYDDPRLELVISDGMDFVQKNAENGGDKFDIIISDSTDPIGPGEVLFSNDFYALAKSCLNSNGILVTQNGVPFFQEEEIQNTHYRMSKHFNDMRFYCAPVPTYYGGFMTFAWGSDSTAYSEIEEATVTERFQASDIATRYYNPAIHKASFALPQYISCAFEQNDKR